MKGLLVFVVCDGEKEEEALIERRIIPERYRVVQAEGKR